MAGRSIVGPMGLEIAELFGLSRGSFPQGYMWPFLPARHAPTHPNSILTFIFYLRTNPLIVSSLFHHRFTRQIARYLVIQQSQALVLLNLLSSPLRLAFHTYCSADLSSNPSTIRMTTLYVLDTLVLASDYPASNPQKTSKHLPRNWHGNSS